MRYFFLIAICLFAGACAVESADQPTLGYYCGLATVYPYMPVYDDNPDCLHGIGKIASDVSEMPRSAPLPPKNKMCDWVDQSSGNTFYEWQPRAVPTDLRQYIEETRICYFADHGPPKGQIGSFAPPNRHPAHAMGSLG
jgi:hypothetical protein